MMMDTEELPVITFWAQHPVENKNTEDTCTYESVLPDVLKKNNYRDSSISYSTAAENNTAFFRPWILFVGSELNIAKKSIFVKLPFTIP